MTYPFQVSPYVADMPNPSPAVAVNQPRKPAPAPDNNVVWQRFSVPFEYPVIFTDRLFSAGNLTLVNCLAHREPGKRHKMIVFIDDGVVNAIPDLENDISHYADVHASAIDLVCRPQPMPGGEKIKTDMHFVEQMQKTLADHCLDRHSFVIGIGGGALLDAVGLVAATSHRGIRHVRIPTTVLAQNDSGVGVKNSVNRFGQKNYLGTFAPPYAVINDYAFIRSLSTRDKIAGMAEAVKVALIRDAIFYQWLEQKADKLAVFEEAAMQKMIRRCAELHMHQIANGGDPFETGSARPLDFGHWAAHKLESMTEYQLRHGEAVAIGLVLDTHYSQSCGLLAQGGAGKVCRLLERLGFTLWHPALETRSSNETLELVQGLKDFREHLGGRLTITLLQNLGVGVEVHNIDHQLVEQSIHWLKQRAV